MQKIILSLIAILGIWLPQLTAAQGTLYLSNLGEPSAGSAAAGSDQWIATEFRAGSNSGGYVLNSIQLLMGAASGTPSGFSVFLYDTNGARQPNNNLGTLIGTDPAVGGTFAYAASDITLSPFGSYFVVITSASAVANGAYPWRNAATLNYDASDRWIAFGISYTSINGTEWTRQDGPFQFAINATAVPEPATLTFVSLGLVYFGLWRSKQRQVQNPNLRV